MLAFPSDNQSVSGDVDLYIFQVHLELLYCPFGMKSGFTNPFAKNDSLTSLERMLKNGTEEEIAENGGEVKKKRKEVIIRGVLSVTVISADDLAPADLMGKADPYVVLTLKKTEAKNKTRVCCTSFIHTSTDVMLHLFN